jgi:hypothetical protein
MGPAYISGMTSMASRSLSRVSEPVLSAVKGGGFTKAIALEKKWIDTTREKLGNPTDLALLQKTFDRMK